MLLASPPYHQREILSPPYRLCARHTLKRIRNSGISAMGARAQADGHLYWSGDDDDDDGGMAAVQKIKHIFGR